MTNMNNNTINTTNITNSEISTKTITVSQEIRVPDFTNSINSALQKISSYDEQIATEEAKLDMKIKAKINEIKIWFVAIFDPFMEISPEDFKKLFTVGGSMNKRTTNPTKDLEYSISITPSCSNRYGQEFRIHLNMDDDTYIEVNIFKTHSEVNIKYPKYLTQTISGEIFFKLWEQYKLMTKEIIERRIDEVIKKREGKINELQEKMSFFDTFTI